MKLIKMTSGATCIGRTIITPEDPPFAVPDEVAERLVGQGAAKYVNDDDNNDGITPKNQPRREEV